MTFRDKLNSYLAAGYPLMACESPEEARVITELAGALVKANPPRSIYRFDRADGLIGISEAGDAITVPGVETRDPQEVITQWMDNFKENSVLIMLDMHHSFQDEIFLRVIRNSLFTLKSTGRHIILVAPTMKLPPDLKHDTLSLDFPLPREDELIDLVTETYLQSLKKIGFKAPTKELTRSIARAAMGLTTVEAENALAYCSVVSAKQSNLALNDSFSRLVFHEKVSQLKQGFFDYKPTTHGFEALGGMENLKEWANIRKQGFTEQARDYNLPYPKGVLMVGVRGGGKSMCAKAIAHEYGFPLFDLNLGRLFGGIIGDTESNTRSLLRLLEGIGEAVVCIDEIDKYLNRSATGGGGDSGVASRMLGTFLTWLAEKTVPVFFVATANNVDSLPPELLRKGRFDDIFFVDAPIPDERRAIFKSLLTYRYKVTPDMERVETLLLDTEGFTGADINSAIEDALYATLTLKNKSEFWNLLSVQVKMQKTAVQANTSYLEGMRNGPGRIYRPANRKEEKVKANGRSIRIPN